MTEVIICSGARHVGKKIAKKMNASWQEIEYRKFPDGESHIRYVKDVRGKNLLLVQSFYGNINDQIIEVLLAFHTAKDLGAKKVELLSLYPPYFRQDTRFKAGEAVSLKVMGKILGVFDKIYFIDPHLHRIDNVKKAFKNGERLSSARIIANYINKLRLKNPIFVGPDIESDQWTSKISIMLGKEHTTMRKKRYGDRKVDIWLTGHVYAKGREIVIIDDIISTGRTVLKAIKLLEKLKPSKIYCIAIHGIFLDDSLKQLEKHATVISTNTIPSKVAKIDISGIVEEMI